MLIEMLEIVLAAKILAPSKSGALA